MVEHSNIFNFQQPICLQCLANLCNYGNYTELICRSNIQKAVKYYIQTCVVILSVYVDT